MLIAIGSDTQHYTASKIFPYLLSRRPILAVYREESNLVNILKQTGEGEAITFTANESPEIRVEAIYTHLHLLLTMRNQHLPPVPVMLETYTARAMTKRLADVFDHVVTGFHHP